MFHHHISYSASGGAAGYMLPAELSIIVPTFNEAENVALLARSIEGALPGIAWEIIFVDDQSPDGTSQVVRAMAQADPRIRLLSRHGRRGLAGACIEGMLASAAPYVAVIDSDLQHDEAILGTMLGYLKSGGADLAIGSRYCAEGNVGDWRRHRQRLSRLATWMARRLTGVAMTDPMSGFFMIRRDAFLRSLPELSSAGFKILLDIAASAPEPLRVAEIPYGFRERQRGASKLDSLVAWEYLQLILDKLIGRIVPPRFVSFAIIGSFGILVHFAILSVLYKAFGYAFEQAQIGATIVAISSNFFFNNALTYRDQRLQGAGLVAGWGTFNLVCAIGAIANLGTAEWLFGRGASWMSAAVAGALIGAVWNYTMSSIFTWRRAR